MEWKSKAGGEKSDGLEQKGKDVREEGWVLQQKRKCRGMVEVGGPANLSLETTASQAGYLGDWYKDMQINET